MKTVIQSMILALSFTSSISLAVPKTPQECEKWNPPRGATWRYQVTRNFEVKDDQYIYLDHFVPAGMWEGSVITRQGFQFSYTLPNHPGNASWTTSYDLKEEQAKCRVTPQCSDFETIVVPAGAYKVCKSNFNDPWGKPAWTRYKAPNLPIDGNVRLEWRSPYDFDPRVVRYDLVEVK